MPLGVRKSCAFPKSEKIYERLRRELGGGAAINIREPTGAAQLLRTPSGKPYVVPSLLSLSWLL